MLFESNEDFFGDNRRRKQDDERLAPGHSDNYTMEEMQFMVRTSRAIPEELKESVAIMIAKAAPLDKQYAASQPHFRTGVFGGKHWAIRKDDFTLIEIVAATAIAAAAFATTVAASPAALTVTLLFAVLKVADQLRRKGASLYDKQYEIIVI